MVRASRRLTFLSLSIQPQLTRYSPKILCLDLSDHASLAEKCQEALGFYGRVDIVINNAGVSSRASVLDTDLAVDRKVMEVNFFGTIGLTKGSVYSHALLIVLVIR